MQVPPPFDYVRAMSVDDAVALLERHEPGSRVIAGGHSLLPMMKLRLARPETLIDINDLTDLSYVRLDGGEIAIGALTRHADLLGSPLLAEHWPIFADAERVIADPIVRNRGTIGGSLCQADPAEDLSAVCSALRAVAVVHRRGGTEQIPIRDIFSGPYETAVGSGLLVEVRVPVRPGAGSAYEKVERRAGDWAIAAAGAYLVVDDGAVADVGIGLTAVGAANFACSDGEDVLRGGPATFDRFHAAAEACRDACAPQSDQRGPEDYKRHLVEVLVERALRRAFARVTGS